MTKIFRSSFYRSKQPEEEEEEEPAAGEYEFVDLEDGKGGKHAAGGGGGGVNSDAPLASGAALTTIIGVSCILVGCFYLVCPCGLEPGAVWQEATFVVIAGALFLAFAAAAFACLAVLRGYACGSCWRTSPVSG